MKIQKIIKPSLDYIENNLKTDIMAEELAKMVGYSTYHYYRLFSTVTGLSVSGYILKRRLDHALAEIASGRKSIEVVLEYGFDTYAGFYKAFKKLYGCSPKKYLSIYHTHKPNKPEVANMRIYSRNELKKVLENWDIPKDLPIGDVYIVNGKRVDDTEWTIGNDYLLKTGDRMGRLKHLKIAKALSKQGFSAASPLKTISGNDFLDGEDFFILSHSINGKAISIIERYSEKLNEYALGCGRGIAKLHKALKDVENDIMPDEVNLYQNVIDWALPETQKQNKQWNMDIDESFFEDYNESFGKVYPSLPKQLIHRNPCPSSVLYDKYKVVGFEDFDLSEYNIRLFDPCYAATAILSETEDLDLYPKWLDILSGILKGYDEIAHLTKDEKQSIFNVICSIQMICIAFFESNDEYKELAKISRRMMQFIINNKESIKNIF